MPQPVITALAQGNCAHGGKATFVSTASKVLFDSGPPLVLGDKGIVAGCAFTVPTGKPQPCVTVLLMQTASKVLVEGRAVILQSPGDICQSAEQVPQGPVAYTKVQTKVVAT